MTGTLQDSLLNFRLDCIASRDPSKLDSIVTSVIHKFEDRAKMGKEKYGTDLDRTDLSLSDWIKHAQEEHMDAILYLEKILKTCNS